MKSEREYLFTSRGIELPIIHLNIHFKAPVFLNHLSVNKILLLSGWKRAICSWKRQARGNRLMDLEGPKLWCPGACLQDLYESQSLWEGHKCKPLHGCWLLLFWKPSVTCRIKSKFIGLAFQVFSFCSRQAVPHWPLSMCWDSTLVSICYTAYQSHSSSNFSLLPYKVGQRAMWLF